MKGDALDADASPSLSRIELQGKISGADLERLVLVGGDLQYLADLSRDRLPTHTEIRWCANVLRRILIDNQLRLLWKSMNAPAGFQPVLRAVDIDAILQQWPSSWLMYGWAGGAPTSAANHQGLLVWAVPKEDWEPYGSQDAFLRAKQLPGSGESRLMSVDQWLKSTSVAVRTDQGPLSISRAEVVKYLANRKGGVHFDPRRDFSVTKQRKRLQESKFRLLDHGLLRVGHLSGPEYEVASMAHLIADSDWAAEIVRIAREAAPDDFEGDKNEIKFWTGLREADGTGWATMKFPSTA